MATTLNKSNREAILHAIIKATFEKREKSLIRSRAELADRAYYTVMPANFIKMTTAYPSDWFQHLTGVYIKDKFERGSFYFPLSGDREVRMPGPRPFPAYVRPAWQTPILEIDSERHGELLEDVKAQIALESALDEERSKLRGELSALLYSIKTVEKLIEAAPDLAGYIPDDIKNAAQRVGLPVVQVGSVISSLKAAGLAVPKQS